MFEKHVNDRSWRLRSELPLLLLYYAKSAAKHLKKLRREKTLIVTYLVVINKEVHYFTMFVNVKLD